MNRTDAQRAADDRMTGAVRAVVDAYDLVTPGMTVTDYLCVVEANVALT